MDELFDFTIVTYSGSNLKSLNMDIAGICRNIFSDIGGVAHPITKCHDEYYGNYFCYRFCMAFGEKEIGCVVCREPDSSGLVVVEVVVCLAPYATQIMSDFLAHQRFVPRPNNTFLTFEYSVPGVVDCSPELCDLGFDVHSVRTDVDGNIRTVWRSV